MSTVNELLSQARRLPDGEPAKIRLNEQAISLADQGNDLGLQYKSRIALVEAAAFSGHPEKVLVNFGWCIAQCEKFPEQFPLPDILWKYKYVIACAVGFHSISRETLEQLLTNMHRHYEQAGFSLRPVHYMRAHMHLYAGEFEDCLQQLQISRGLEKDRFADCSACEVNFIVTALVALKRDQEAIQAAQPLLQGNEGCAEVPHLTFAALLSSTSRLGNKELGTLLLTSGYQLIRSNPEFLYQIGLQMQYCAEQALIDTGLERLQSHCDWLLASMDPGGRLQFQMGAAMVLNKALQQGQTSLVLRLPNSFALFNPAGEYSTQQLCEYFSQQALMAAQGFDQRNGNRYYQLQLAENLA
ncbi:hypothetical protein ABC502_08150 [Alkalimonas sp. NCh-2]|uniref:hypothetical protein n=1 Tax=Alkalimonas sp. NCh-2 TaxID=3144846 RepID=UPI0031F6C4F3